MAGESLEVREARLNLVDALMCRIDTDEFNALMSDGDGENVVGLVLAALIETLSMKYMVGKNARKDIEILVKHEESKGPTAAEAEAEKDILNGYAL